MKAKTGYWMGTALRLGGFTLLETLIALVIAAVAASVILSHVRTLMLRSEKEQAHQTVVLQLLNDSLRLAHGAMPAAPVPRIEKDELWIDLTDKDWADMPPVRVSNFSARGEALPPTSFAYTPFQLYATARDRYALFAIAPSLKPPTGVTSDAYLPAPLPEPVPDKPPEAPVVAPSPIPDNPPEAPTVAPSLVPDKPPEPPAAAPSPASATPMDAAQGI